MSLIIGLGSKARIGKDYAAQELAKHFDLQRIAFADALKKDVADMFARHGLDYWAIEKQPELKEKVRPLLVEYGNTMRKFNEDIWVNRALGDVDDSKQVTVITDVRFPNEARRIKALGGYFIDIETDIPPINECEALYAPQMRELADHVVKNNFDSNFITDLVSLVNELWQKTPSKGLDTTPSMVGNISLPTLIQLLS